MRGLCGVCAAALSCAPAVGALSPQAVDEPSGTREVIAEEPDAHSDDAAVFEEPPTFAQLLIAGLIDAEWDGIPEGGPGAQPEGSAPGPSEAAAGAASPDLDEPPLDEEPDLIGNARKLRMRAVMEGRVRERFPRAPDPVLDEAPLHEGVNAEGYAYAYYEKRGYIMSTEWPEHVLNSEEEQRRLLLTENGTALPGRRLVAPYTCSDGSPLYDFGAYPNYRQSWNAEWRICLDHWTDGYNIWCVVTGPVSAIHLQGHDGLWTTESLMVKNQIPGWEWGVTTQCVDVHSPVGDGNRWQWCPAGYFFTGIYRGSTTYHDMRDVQKLRCCRKRGWKKENRDCAETDHWVTGPSSWHYCADHAQRAVVGIYWGYNWNGRGHTVRNLRKTYCCRVPCFQPSALMSVPGVNQLRAQGTVNINDGDPDNAANYEHSKRLRKNECLSSANGNFKLCLKWNGQLCAIRRSDNVEYWCAKEVGKHARELVLRDNGAVEIINGADEALWSFFNEDMSCAGSVHLKLSDTGNVHIPCRSKLYANTWRIVMSLWSTSHSGDNNGSGNRGALYRDTLFTWEILHKRDFLISRNRQWIAYVVQDGNLCLYQKNDANERVENPGVNLLFGWKHGSIGSYCTNTNGAVDFFQLGQRGMFQGHASGSVVWSSPDPGLGGNTWSLYMADDGDLYVRNVFGLPVWSARKGMWPSTIGIDQSWIYTRLYRGNMMRSPDGKLRLQHQPDGNLCAYKWELGSGATNPVKSWCSHRAPGGSVNGMAYYEFTPHGTVQSWFWHDTAEGGRILDKEIDASNIGGEGDIIQSAHSAW